MADGEQADDTQKTEDPTPKRLEESRKKGQVAISREMNNWIMLAAATILIGAASPGVLGRLKAHLKAYIEHAHDFPRVPEGFSVLLGDSFLRVLAILALPFLALMAAAFIGPFIQVGPIFAPDVIKPDLSKISPLRGFGRLFSRRALVEFVKGLLKLGVIGAVEYFMLRPFFGQADHLVGLPLPLMLAELLTLVIRLLTGILVALLVIAAVDVAFQRVEHYRKMRMTKQELKDEYKQSEGDPHVKAKLRQLRSERARQRMMQNVPKADVVITNPTHFAVALQYNPDTMEAPLCLAKGMDAVALRIREIAKEHGIVIYENPPLARVLFDTVEIEETIPQEHYKAVAEVISYVFRLKGKLSG